MITNTELEYKGDLYPSRIISFEQDGDPFIFTRTNVILKVTSLEEIVYPLSFLTTKAIFSNDFSYAIDKKSHLHGYNILEVLSI
jgi:alpha-glucosidase